MISIVKKEEGAVVEEYRGVTLMATLYKIYASALVERLREEVEQKAVIPHNQTGFSKGIGTIDVIDGIGRVIDEGNRERERKERKGEGN